MKKIKQIMVLICAVAMMFAFTACGSSNDTKESSKNDSEKTELYILAAASMTDVLNELAESYEKEHSDVKLNFSFASSGDLQTQIEEGAPADVFISAAQKQMNALKEENLMDNDSIINLLENKVVLIKHKDSNLDVTSFEDAATDKVEMIAIGNPDSVPVGQYTQMIYENLGLWDAIKEKANLGKDVRQVLDWVATENVDCGIVYATDAAIEDDVEVICEAPADSCDPAIYPAGVVKASENHEAAQDFLDFLKTEEAKQAFEKYQFTYIYSE